MEPNRSSESQSPAADSAETLREKVVSLLTAEQVSLRYYLVSLLGDHSAADNVLQETNIVLWRKASEFKVGTSFSAWSKEVAYWQALAYVRDRNRDKHVFSEKLMEQIAARPTVDTEVSEAKLALRHCLSLLSPENHELIRRRYTSGDSIAALAKHIGGSSSAVHVRLHRIRRCLLGCIQKQMNSCE